MSEIPTPKKMPHSEEIIENNQSSKKQKGFFGTFYKNHKESILYTLDILVNGVVILGLVVLIRHFLISPFQVSGSSMCDNLNYIGNKCITKFENGGEYIIIDKTYKYRDPSRGDVVVFTPPNHESDYYVKRIIGLPGEKVVIKNGSVWIFNTEYPNGVKLKESYLNETNNENTHPDGEYSVPENNFFVMGDNRNGSFDGRHWRNEIGESTPFITKEHIDGKVWLVLWPLDNMRVFPEYDYEI